MKPKVRTAVILGGGPATFNSCAIAAYSKFLLPVANRPLYHYLAAALVSVGVERLIFCITPGLGKVVEEKLAAVAGPCQCLVQETSLGSGGSLQEVAAWLEDAPFWVAGGDLLLDEDLARMLAFHEDHGDLATVASWRTQELPWEMERVEVGAEQDIRAIHRLHPSQEKRSVFRPAGLYLFEPAILAAIPEGKYFDLKEQLFPRLYEVGQSGRVWEITGYCRAITSMEDYFFANQDVLLKRVQVPEKIGEFEATPGPGPCLSKSCRVYQPVVIGAGAALEDGVMVLGPSAIGPGCQIASGAVINGCVLMGDNRIGPGVYLERCLIGAGTEVPGDTVQHQAALLTKAGQEAAVRLQLNRNGKDSIFKRLGGPKPISKVYLACKRLFDLMVATLVLIITAPLFLAIAVAVREESLGGAVFQQERCGKNGVPFEMYKFRSMVQEAEEVKRRIRDLNEADGPVFKITDDPRTTRLGRILRDTNLDELPQLWNVLRGEMSLVGPRPLAMEEMQFSPRWRDARLALRPGMTGLWQMNAHSKTQFNEWIIYDLDYVNRASFRLDLEILLKTFRKSVAGVTKLLRRKREVS
jgi:lipopolysaccharide/colanic/teichoic acid biosynthesis glycosyltransferase/dTDP-glucose pyrophosphorylase